ncbi:hypothetical protein QTA56_05150 [Acinetobacter sp. VNH17]|uniref:Uncharacterized protein n=1 Tax=Acinetobacter thutiue TaxID=2998078 RepID=A0ABT7WLR1_9GAMM|nr:hypothetical protein [Acinetobacter thutiue]MCY6411528.1 hypothetical protein [Acinetobacter thutiue]MDN0013630.1 hypothetical protein [Acinetobacter thutiue]
MSWERYHFFMLHTEPATHFTLDDINPKLWFESRSDVFGYALENLFAEFKGFEDLHFLQWRDDLSWEQCNATANVFSPDQQPHIINEIQRFFNYLKMMDVKHLYKNGILLEYMNADEFLPSWVEEADDYVQHHIESDLGMDSLSSIENFFGLLCALQLVIKFFQNAHNENLYVIYKTVKP